MAKPKTVETIEFPAFDATKMTDQLRSFAEKGVEQSKEVYAKFKNGAEDAQKALESSFETVKAAGAEVSLAMIAAMRTNAEASFSHFEKMVGASSLAEMIELQTAFVRQQAEKFASQAKDMQDVATKAVERVSEPVKTAFDKAMNEVKAAA
jgi:phasin